MKLNILYGLLTAGLKNSDTFYSKRTIGAYHTPRTYNMYLELIKDIDKDKLILFANFICCSINTSIFGKEILLLDNNNTYSRFSKDPTIEIDDTTNLLWNITKPMQELQILYKWLDDDIKDKLVLPTWLDIVFAVCLQMLRETI